MTCTRAASASSGPATTPTWWPSGYRPSTASSAKLERGARVADVGCGHGASTILMARAFPASTFVGSDYHDGSIETARERPREAGVGDRVRFEVAPAASYPGHDYDLVTMFDCLHDMGDPVGAAAPRPPGPRPGRYLDDRRAGRRGPGGGQPQPRRPRLLRLLDTALHPASLSQEVGLALGAQAGEARIRARSHGGGFNQLLAGGRDTLQPRVRSPALEGLGPHTRTVGRGRPRPGADGQARSGLTPATRTPPASNARRRPGCWRAHVPAARCAPQKRHVSGTLLQALC